MQDNAVNNFPLLGLVVTICIYECLDFSVLQSQKIYFMQGQRRCQLDHLEGQEKGFWCIVPLKRILSYSAPGSLLCFVPRLPPCTGCICGGSISLMKITFTPALLMPIQSTLCNRWALGPRSLSLIAFLKQDQTRSTGGVLAVMWIWWVQQ